jgi:hypothetical protein
LSLPVGDCDKFEGCFLRSECTVGNTGAVGLEEENESSAFEIVTGSFDRAFAIRGYASREDMCYRVKKFWEVAERSMYKAKWY